MPWLLGDFTPFLEIVFAINIFLGFVASLLKKFEEHRKKELEKRLSMFRANAIDCVWVAPYLAGLVNNLRYIDNIYKNGSAYIIYFGRASGVICSISAILLVLFAGLEPNYEIWSSELRFIIYLILPVPFSILGTYFMFQQFKLTLLFVDYIYADYILPTTTIDKYKDLGEIDDLLDSIRDTELSSNSKNNGPSN